MGILVHVVNVGHVVTLVHKDHQGRVEYAEIVVLEEPRVAMETRAV
jgi:hypothetical protein